MVIFKDNHNVLNIYFKYDHFIKNTVKDGQGKLPINYVVNADVKRLLLKSSPPLIKAGLTDSFSRFVH